MSRTFAYISVIREIELGWGDRPDGCIIGLEKEDVESFIRSSISFDREKFPREFSVAGDIRIVRITEKALNEIEKSNEVAIWIRPRDFDDYIIAE